MRKMQCVALVLLTALCLAAPAEAQSANVVVCGTVTAYVPPTSITAGLIVIGGQSIPIAIGANLAGAGQIATGADLCLNGTLDAGGLLTGGTVTANVTTTVNVCGVVSAYQAATASAAGSITIGGQTFPIAAGTNIAGSDLVQLGADLCLDGTLNGAGQLVVPSSVSANATTTVRVCGVVSAYTAATASSPGSITIGGQTIPIAAGTSIAGSGLITAGADLCLNGTLNASGQLVVPSSVSANAGTSVSVCGVVSAYTAATASSPGSITIGGQTIPIAAGTTIDGSGLITLGANLCLNGTVNAAGQLVVPSSVSANAGASVNVCGVVSAYTAATAISPGSITIGGQTIPIAAGTAIDGSGLVTLGANLCLNGTLNASGQLVAPSSVTVNAGASVNVCGVVSAYTAATASSPGSITIGGQTIPIAAGTTIDGSGLITLGADLCLNGTLNASGQLVVPSSVSANAGASVNVCGVVSAYTAATASSPGSISIGGQTIPIAAGTALNGAGQIQLGAQFCLSGTLNASGQLSGGTLTVGAATTLDLCGIVSAFTPASAAAPGSITIGGQTFSIAPGVSFGPEVRVGAVLCFNDVPVAPAPGGGTQIVGGAPGGGGGGGGGPIPSAPANEIIFPIATRVTGVGGAHWQTDLSVLNHGASPATVTIEWYPFAPGGRPGPAQTADVVVNPGVQGLYVRSIEMLFHTEGGGSLRLVSASFEIAAALRVYHEKTTEPCAGAFGMFEKGLRRSESYPRAALLLLGHTPSDMRHIRTNVGFFNASPDAALATFRVHASDGRILGSKTMTIAGFANDQKSIFELVDSVPQSERNQRDLYATFEVQGGLLFAYGAAVYNSSNDALYVIPWQY